MSARNQLMAALCERKRYGRPHTFQADYNLVKKRVIALSACGSLFGLLYGTTRGAVPATMMAVSTAFGTGLWSSVFFGLREVFCDKLQRRGADITMISGGFSGFFVGGLMGKKMAFQSCLGLAVICPTVELLASLRMQGTSEPFRDKLARITPGWFPVRTLSTAQLNKIEEMQQEHKQLARKYDKVREQEDTPGAPRSL